MIWIHPIRPYMENAYSFNLSWDFISAAGWVAPGGIYKDKFCFSLLHAVPLILMGLERLLKRTWFVTLPCLHSEAMQL